jgi:predicted transcriptional regulator
MHKGQAMDPLPSCIEALRVLAQTKDPNRVVLIERAIDQYLKTETGRLQRLRDAINWQKAAKRKGEDWNIAKDYVRSLLHGQR